MLKSIVETFKVFKLFAYNHDATNKNLTFDQDWSTPFFKIYVRWQQASIFSEFINDWLQANVTHQLTYFF